MESGDFYEGLKTEEEQNGEFVAGAEHFIRLKKQSRTDAPIQGFEDVPLETKEASADWKRTFFNKAPVLHMPAPQGQVKMGTLAQALQKLGYEIKPSDRPDIPKKDFAQPNKEEEGHKGKYPIPDEQHARSALGFAKMHGDTAALSAVKKKIHQKFPDMDTGGGKEKEAEVPGILKDPKVLGALIGGAVGAGGSLLSSRSKEELGGRSSTEDKLRKDVASQKKEGPNTGFLDKLRNRNSELAHGYAKAFRQHPVKGALVGGGVGAIAGLQLARRLGAGGK